MCDPSTIWCMVNASGVAGVLGILTVSVGKPQPQFYGVPAHLSGSNPSDAESLSQGLSNTLSAPCMLNQISHGEPSL